MTGKKIIIALILCLMALLCVWAGQTSLRGQISPYSLQGVFIAGDKYYSTYGFAFRGGMRHNIWNNLTVGADFDLEIYRYKVIDSSYVILGLMPKAGYWLDFSEVLFAEAEIGLGLQARKVANKAQHAFGMKLYLGAGYRFNEKISATLGVDLGLGFQKGKNSSSTDFSVQTQLGVIYVM